MYYHYIYADESYYNLYESLEDSAVSSTVFSMPTDAKNIIDYPLSILFKDIYKDYSASDYSFEVAMYLSTREKEVTPTELATYNSFKENCNIRELYNSFIDTFSSEVEEDTFYASRDFSSLRDLDLSILNSGVIVNLVITRWRGHTTLTSKDLGISATSKADNELIDLGRKCLLPKTVLRKFDALESKARNLLKKYSISCPWGHFVPTSLLPKWHAENEAIKLQYLNEAKELKDNLRKHTSEILKKYTEYAPIAFRRESAFNKSLPHSMPSSWTTDYINNIKRKIPHESTILRSFTYESTFFQLPVNLLDPEISKIIPQDLTPLTFYGDIFETTLANMVQEVVEIIDSDYITKDAKSVKKTYVNKLNNCLNEFLFKVYKEDKRPEVLKLSEICSSYLAIEDLKKEDFQIYLYKIRNYVYDIFYTGRPT